VQVEKSNTSKRLRPDVEPKATVDPAKPIFGSAKGQIVFKIGWDAPMTKRQLDEFIGH
jgi:hypothetical protein